MACSGSATGVARRTFNDSWNLLSAATTAAVKTTADGVNMPLSLAWPGIKAGTPLSKNTKQQVNNGGFQTMKMLIMNQINQTCNQMME